MIENKPNMENLYIHNNTVIDISSFPLKLRDELLDFYEFLIHKHEQNELVNKKKRELTQMLSGKYKHIQTSPQMFALSKQFEKNLEL